LRQTFTKSPNGGIRTIADLRKTGLQDDVDTMYIVGPSAAPGIDEWRGRLIFEL
jgi:hypothetical protein